MESKGLWKELSVLWVTLRACSEVLCGSGSLLTLGNSCVGDRLKSEDRELLILIMEAMVRQLSG